MSLSARIAAMYSVSPTSTVKAEEQDAWGTHHAKFPVSSTRCNVRFHLPSPCESSSAALDCMATSRNIQELPFTSPTKSSLRPILKYTTGTTLPCPPLAPSSYSDADTVHGGSAPSPDCAGTADHSIKWQNAAAHHRDSLQIRATVRRQESHYLHLGSNEPSARADPEHQQRRHRAASLIQRTVQAWYHRRQLDRVAFLERALVDVERRRQEELREVQGTVVQHRRDVNHTQVREAQCLEARVQENLVCLKELRREHRKLRTDRDELARQVTEAKAEHQRLLLESDLLKHQVEAARHAMAVYTTTNNSWVSAEQLYVEHLRDYQALIDDRVSRTDMEKWQRDLYDKALQSMLKLIGSHPKAKKSLKRAQVVWDEILWPHPLA